MSDSESETTDDHNPFTNSEKKPTSEVTTDNSNTTGKKLIHTNLLGWSLGLTQNQTFTKKQKNL